MTVHKTQSNRTLLRTRLPVLLLTFIFLGFPHSVFACQCPGPGNPVDWFKKSDVVFLGTGIKVNDDSSLSGPVTFRVDKTWKGVSKTQVVLHSETLCEDSVGYGPYLVYAGKSKRNGELSQYGCSHVRAVEKMDVELHMLDLVAAGVKEKKIFKEILGIAKNHKKISHRVQAVKLIMRIRGKSLDNLPKDTDKILKELTKNPEPELNRAASSSLNYLKMMRN